MVTSSTRCVTASTGRCEGIVDSLQRSFGLLRNVTDGAIIRRKANLSAHINQASIRHGIAKARGEPRIRTPCGVEAFWFFALSDDCLQQRHDEQRRDVRAAIHRTNYETRTHPFHSILGFLPPLSDPFGVDLASERRMAGSPWVPLAWCEVCTHSS
jgi:hypothetical protein